MLSFPGVYYVTDAWQHASSYGDPVSLYEGIKTTNPYQVDGLQRPCQIPPSASRVIRINQIGKRTTMVKSHRKNNRGDPAIPKASFISSPRSPPLGTMSSKMPPQITIATREQISFRFDRLRFPTSKYAMSRICNMSRNSDILSSRSAGAELWNGDRFQGANRIENFVIGRLSRQTTWGSFRFIIHTSKRWNSHEKKSTWCLESVCCITQRRFNVHRIIFQWISSDCDNCHRIHTDCTFEVMWSCAWIGKYLFIHTRVVHEVRRRVVRTFFAIALHLQSWQYLEWYCAQDNVELWVIDFIKVQSFYAII